MSRRRLPDFDRRNWLVGFLIAAAILMGWPLPSCTLQAAPTFVQAAANKITSGSANGRTFPNANTAGNLMVAYVVWSNTGTVTLSDSKGNFYAKNIVGSSNNAVTVTFDRSTAYVDLRIAEYSGLDRSNPFDVTASATGTSQTVNSGSVVTTSPNELLLAGGTTGVVFTGAGTGYTTRIITQPNAGIVQDRIVTSAGTYDASASHPTSAYWVMQLVTFRAPSL